MAHSTTYLAEEKGFRAALKSSGVPIVFNGVRRQCITGDIERRRHQNVVAVLGEASTSVEMLERDFLALGPIVANRSIVTIDGSQFGVSYIASDRATPIVRFTASGDH